MTIAAAPLGNIGSIASTSPREKARKANTRGWKIQKGVGDLLPNEAVALCCRHIVPGKSGVPIVRNTKTKMAHYRNLMTCGSVWVCPICSSKISEGRRVELTQAVTGWKGTKLLITFTLQHDRDDKLVTLRDALNEAYRKLKSGRWFQDFEAEFGVVASVAATEITWGEASGWHIHKHVLLFSDHDQADFELETFKSRLIDRYTSILARAGRYASSLYGIDVQTGDDKVGDYASKWGLEHEITKANVKKAHGGYSPFQLIELYQGGKEWAGALFQEFGKAMKGHNQLVWSRGGRAAVGLGVEQPDVELAAKEEDLDVGENVVLAVLNYEQFKAVCDYKKRGELLEVADSGDPFAIWDFLERECKVLPTWEQREGVLFDGS